MKEQLTEALLGSLPAAPPGKRVMIFDTEVPHFAVRITEKRSMTFLLQLRNAGKPERITIGKHPNVSVDEARLLASQRLDEIRKSLPAPATNHVEVQPPPEAIVKSRKYTRKKPQSKNRIELTDAVLARLRPARVNQRLVYWDCQTRYLSLLVSSKGTKTFVYYSFHEGKPYRKWIGKWPAVSLSEARSVAELITESLRKGVHLSYSSSIASEATDISDMYLPAIEILHVVPYVESTFDDYHDDCINNVDRGVPGKITLIQLFRCYIQDHARVHCRTWKRIISEFRVHLNHWRDRQLDSITRAEVRTWHARVGSTGTRTAANRALGLLKTLYQRAADWDLYDSKNPTNGIKRFREESRSRFLDSDELPKLIESIEQHATPIVRDFFMMCLFTAQRFANVSAMRWEQVNLETRIWTIPGASMKNGDWHRVPLVPQAMEILQRRRNEVDSRTEWVFPSTRNSGSGHLTKPHRDWYKSLDEAGIKNLRIHDLRRTNAAWQAASGTSLLVIGKSLNHRNPSTTAIYARLNIEPVRDSMTGAVNAMCKAIDYKTGEIVLVKDSTFESACQEIAEKAKAAGMSAEEGIATFVRCWLKDDV